jgi:hypothetical protein
MSDPFAVRELRIRQPARVLPGRARYDIFDAGRTLLAVAAETSPRSVLQTVADLVPRTRVIGVRSASGEPLLTLVKRDSDWLVDVTDPDGRLIGRIQIGETRSGTPMSARRGRGSGRSCSPRPTTTRSPLPGRCRRTSS